MSRCVPPSLPLATRPFLSIRLSSVKTVVYASSSCSESPRCRSATDCAPRAHRNSRIDACRVPSARPRSAFFLGLILVHEYTTPPRILPTSDRRATTFFKGVTTVHSPPSAGRSLRVSVDGLGTAIRRSPARGELCPLPYRTAQRCGMLLGPASAEEIRVDPMRAKHAALAAARLGRP